MCCLSGNLDKAVIMSNELNEYDYMYQRPWSYQGRYAYVGASGYRERPHIHDITSSHKTCCVYIHFIRQHLKMVVAELVARAFNLHGNCHCSLSLASLARWAVSLPLSERCEFDPRLGVRNRLSKTWVWRTSVPRRWYHQAPRLPIHLVRHHYCHIVFVAQQRRSNLHLIYLTIWVSVCQRPDGLNNHENSSSRVQFLLGDKEFFP